MNETPCPAAGIDVSKDFSEMCIIAPDNTVFRRIKIYHDRTSMERSLLTLQETEDAFGLKPILVMESTSHYHRLLWQFMSGAGYEVLVINPLQSGGMKNINVRKVKNDKVDAYKLALLFRLKTLRPSITPTADIAALRDLCRQHIEVMNDVTRYTNRLRAILDQAFPGYLNVFSEPAGKGSLLLLEQYPTPDEMLSTDRESLAIILKANCRRGATWATDKAAKLMSAAKAAAEICLRRDSYAVLVRSCISTLRFLLENVKATDIVMRQIVSENTQLACNVALLQSIPGIGEFSAMVLLAEMGDLAAFAKPKQLTSFFGLDPSERQSGKFRGTKNKISKRGSRYARNILNMAAYNCVYKNPKTGKQSNPVLADYFEKKCNSKPVKVAICAVMHKIVNIIFAVLRDQKPFELRAPEEHDRMLLERNTKMAA